MTNNTIRFSVLKSLSAFTTCRDSSDDSVFFMKLGKGVKLDKDEKAALSDELRELGGVYNGTRHAWFFNADPHPIVMAARHDKPLPDLTEMLKWRDEREAKKETSAKKATGEMAKKLEALYGLVSDFVFLLDSNRKGDKIHLAAQKANIVTALTELAEGKFEVDVEDANAIIYGIYQKFQTKRDIRKEKDWYQVSVSSFKSNVRAYIWDRVNDAAKAEEVRKAATEEAVA